MWFTWMTLALAGAVVSAASEPSTYSVGVAKIDGDPVFNNAKCAVLRVEPQDKAAPIEGLSKREREIALARRVLERR